MIGLEIEELRALIAGKFDFRKCLECDGKGWIWADCVNGVHVVAPDPSRDPLEFSKEQCEDCKGIGGSLKIHPTRS